MAKGKYSKSKVNPPVSKPMQEVEAADEVVDEVEVEAADEVVDEVEVEAADEVVDECQIILRHNVRHDGFRYMLGKEYTVSKALKAFFLEKNFIS